MKTMVTCLRILSLSSLLKSVVDKYPKYMIFSILFIFMMGYLIVFFMKERNKISSGYGFYNHRGDYEEIVCLKKGGCKSKFQPQRVEGFAQVRVGTNSYKIHEDLENPIEAAETMDKLNTTANKLIDHLFQSYIKGASIKELHPKYQSIVRKGIASLKKNFKSANMEENIPERSGGDTSYVIDKGDVFAMCLRDPKKSNKLENDYNSLTFVLIHELAHIFTSSYGHDDLFWNNFKFLLEESVKIGIYTPVDYKQFKAPYCGIVISYTPLTDGRLMQYRKSVQN